jgi:DNA-binding NtrC family response regulator
MAISSAVEAGASLKEIGKNAEEAAIQMVVNLEGGNLQRAAERLQVTDRALQLRLAARRNSLAQFARSKSRDYVTDAN